MEENYSFLCCHESLQWFFGESTSCPTDQEQWNNERRHTTHHVGAEFLKAVGHWMVWLSFSSLCYENVVSQMEGVLLALILEWRRFDFIPHIKTNSKWVKDLDTRTKTTKHLEENRGMILHDLGFDDDFLVLTPKTWTTRWIRLYQSWKLLCLKGPLSRKWKDNLQNGKKHLQINADVC